MSLYEINGLIVSKSWSLELFEGIGLHFVPCDEVCNNYRLKLPVKRLVLSEPHLGRIEWIFEQNESVVYRGRCMELTISIDMPLANESISKLLGNDKFELSGLLEKYNAASNPTLICSNDQLRMIVNQLSNPPVNCRNCYMKVKVLELLLELHLEQKSSLELLGRKIYYSKKHIEIVELIKCLLEQNPERHFTLEELSNKFEIPLTSMKCCFKGIYGCGIYAFIRKHRMDQASDLLVNSSESITAIALRLGYSNPSKFAAAFKAFTGSTPSAYRKDNV